MASLAHDDIDLPRSFCLLEELDVGLGKGGKQIDEPAHDGFVSFGLWQGFLLFIRFIHSDDDATLTRWRCMLIGPQNSTLGQNIYIVEIICPEQYPFHPPFVRFQTRINMECVNQVTGVVDPKKVEILKNWTKRNRIQHICCRLRDLMLAAAKLPQPPVGSTYFND